MNEMTAETEQHMTCLLLRRGENEWMTLQNLHSFGQSGN